tara:strand:+ start:333 stop:584 length:252 start_codon:yes stop_codon:yes gene_type:complete
MKIIFIFTFLFFGFLHAEVIDTEKKVSELSVDELKQIVRQIVEESIEQCIVSGTMEGRAKLNLDVQGEVVAKMSCEFKNDTNE